MLQTRILNNRKIIVQQYSMMYVFHIKSFVPLLYILSLLGLWGSLGEEEGSTSQLHSRQNTRRQQFTLPFTPTGNLAMNLTCVSVQISTKICSIIQFMEINSKLRKICMKISFRTIVLYCNN